jgi:hypothetical protein
MAGTIWPASPGDVDGIRVDVRSIELDGDDADVLDTNPYQLPAPRQFDVWENVKDAKAQRIGWMPCEGNVKRGDAQQHEEEGGDEELCAAGHGGNSG